MADKISKERMVELRTLEADCRDYADAAGADSDDFVEALSDLLAHVDAQGGEIARLSATIERLMSDACMADLASVVIRHEAGRLNGIGLGRAMRIILKRRMDELVARDGDHNNEE